MKNILLIILLMIIITSSCKYDKMQPKQPKVDIGGIWSCTDAQKFDSAKLANKLIGAWKWAGHDNGGGDWIDADKNVIVKYDSTGNFTFQEDTAITNGQWSLYITDFTYYGISMSNVTGIYFYGQILLCDNELLFDAGYIDGPDNLFLKIQ